MPVTARITISPNALMEGDVITEVEFPNKMVISGKTKMVGATVVGVSTGKANATVDTDRGKLILKLDADVWVRREMPTDEELAERKAERAAQARDFHMRSMLRKLQNTFLNVEAARKELAEAATSGRDADSLMRCTMEVAECDARRRIAERILLATGHDGMDILEAAKRIAIGAARELLDRGPDDTWSGRGNDLRRAIFDAQRNFVRDLRSEGVKVFDVNIDFF